MYVIGTFEQSVFLELALASLENAGIRKEEILAVPLDIRKSPTRPLDTIHHADGDSVLDLAAILGTVFMLLGAIYGFKLTWGPILWGIIGAAGGMFAGILIKQSMHRRRMPQHGGTPRRITSEVVLLVSCEERKGETVEDILWANRALGVSRLKPAGIRADGANGKTASD